VVPESASLAPLKIGDRGVRLAVGAGIAWLVLFIVLIAVTEARPRMSDALVDVTYLSPIILAVALSIWTATVTGGRTRAAWTLLSISTGLWLTGEVVWLYYTYLTSLGPPTVSIADFFYLSSYVVALPAILVGVGGAGHLRQLRGLLDAGLLALGLGTIGWELAIVPALPEEPRLADFVAFAYPLLGVAIVTTLAAVGVAGHHRVPSWGVLVGAAFAASGVTDAIYAYSIAQQDGESNWLNVGWQVEAVLFSLGAVVAIRCPVGELPDRRRNRDLTAWPLVVAATAATGLILADRLPDGGLTTKTLVILLLLFAGLLARQLLVIRDGTRMAAKLEVALREQERLAVTDSLTGVYNRRFFQETLDDEAARAGRAGHPLSLLLVDLDEFKKINDNYGHPAGDAALVQVADRIRRSVRPSDVVARYGGEEFVCLLPSAGEAAAVEVAERVRRSVSDRAVALGRGRHVELTSSVGLATAGTHGGRPLGDTEGLVHDADAALYRAKAYGRNQVVSARALADTHVDNDSDLPPALVWLADRIDAKISAHEHSTAVARWSLLVAERLGLAPDARERVAAAGRLHDIGKVSVAEAILRKAAPLDEEEWEVLRRHPDESARLLTELGQRPDLAEVAIAHHERFDGRGYPRRLAGHAIPIEARIVAVTDAWAAMRADRPYARALTEEAARQQLIEGRGSQFDPDVADVFLTLVAEGTVGDLASLWWSPTP